MRKIKIATPDKKGHFTLAEVGDFEYVNPIEKMAEVTMSISMEMDKDFLTFAIENDKRYTHLKGIQNQEEVITKVAAKRAVQTWDKRYKEITASRLPDNLFDILNATSKKEQIKILKGLSLTGDELMAFIFKAWDNYKFTYSTYTSIHNQTGLDKEQMPKFAYKEEDSNLTVIGSTTLSTGQIKQAIEHRHVLVAKFLDKDETWHCFFLTFKSLKGEEKAWKNGQPHLHFISHTWGMTREYALGQLKSRKYNFGSLPHIDFHTHRNPRSE